jgi:hypothetical protein
MLAQSTPTTAPGSGRVLCFACLLLPTWLRLPLQESPEAPRQRAFAAAEATAFVVGNRVKKPWSIVATTGLPTVTPRHARVAQAFRTGSRC